MCPRCSGLNDPERTISLFLADEGQLGVGQPRRSRRMTAGFDWAHRACKYQEREFDYLSVLATDLDRSGSEHGHGNTTEDFTASEPVPFLPLLPLLPLMLIRSSARSTTRRSSCGPVLSKYVRPHDSGPALQPSLRRRLSTFSNGTRRLPLVPSRPFSSQRGDQ